MSYLTKRDRPTEDAIKEGVKVYWKWYHRHSQWEDIPPSADAIEHLVTMIAQATLRNSRKSREP